MRRVTEVVGRGNAMRINNDQAKQILTDVRRICRSSSHWPDCDVDDVEGDVLAVIFGRLNSLEDLQKPLCHFVRSTAKREAKKAFKKLGFLRNRQRLEPDLSVFDQGTERETGISIDGPHMRRLIDGLPVIQRQAVEQFFGFKERSSTFQDYYRKELGVAKLRAQVDQEGEL